MAKLYFILLDCFPFLLHFSSSLIKFYSLELRECLLRLRFFYRQETGRGHGEVGFVLRRLHRTLLGYIIKLTVLLKYSGFTMC